MPLQQQIDDDIKQAMRQRETVKLSTLRLLKSALKNTAIDRGGAETPLSDADVQPVLRKEIKKREDAISNYVKGGRDDLADKERTEVEILTAYLPPAMTETEVDALVCQVISELSEKGGTPKMGDVMKAATAAAAGRVDGKTLSQAVRKQLA